MNEPYVCDDNDVLTVPLVAEKVWEANFEGQIIKCVVLHIIRLKIYIASVMRFWPLNNGSAQISAFWVSFIVIKDAFKIEEGRFVDILAYVFWCLIWLTAELTTYLEVTDAGNWVPQLGELLAAQYKDCLIGFVIFMLLKYDRVEYVQS